MKVLDSVKNYKGLPLLSDYELEELCQEIRDMIIETTLRNGGHLGGSLGAVELCVSLLRVFDPARDKIVFDVGHQTYAYKILTDRRDRFHTLRTKDGISGFPRRQESVYDAFDVGHSSTSISAALGFAKARDLSGKGHEVVAVIGDGALLNGLALEGLNNVGTADTKMLIVLNDNKMSISPRVGGMAEHLAKLSIHPAYRRLKQFVKEQCRSFENGRSVESVLEVLKNKLKSLILPTNIFEELDISYWGPFDGHNVAEMTEIFELSKEYPKSLLIHVITQKGKGCKDAECSPTAFHGIGSGTVLGAVKKKRPEDWSQAVCDTAVKLGEKDFRVAMCTAAMKEGARLDGFCNRFPARFFDVGIAEGHMLTFAAGLAAGGMRPIVSIYSTFLQRAMDQLVHDICLQNLPALLVADRAGLTGEDGETHQGLLDMAWGASVPNLTIGAPRDVVDLDYMCQGWLDRALPVLIRYPKGTAPKAVARDERMAAANWGVSEVLREGDELCLIGVGCMTETMLAAAAELEEFYGVNPTVVDLRFVSPIDWQTVDKLLATHPFVAIAEDGYVNGGVGQIISARSGEIGANCRTACIGVPDVYVPHASRGQQLDFYGLSCEGVLGRVLELIGKTRVNERKSEEYAAAAAG